MNYGRQYGGGPPCSLVDCTFSFVATHDADGSAQLQPNIQKAESSQAYIYAQAATPILEEPKFLLGGQSAQEFRLFAEQLVWGLYMYYWASCLGQVGLQGLPEC